MVDEEKASHIPSRHQEIINELIDGKESADRVSIPEGSYVKIKNEAYGGSFITCPAILLESENGEKSCLHVTYDELIDALQTGTLKRAVDFKELLTDIAESKKISILLTAETSKNESRAEEFNELKKKLAPFLEKVNAKVTFKSVPGNQFQLVITKNDASIWRGTDFVDLL